MLSFLCPLLLSLCRFLRGSGDDLDPKKLQFATRVIFVCMYIIYIYIYCIYVYIYCIYVYIFLVCVCHIVGISHTGSHRKTRFVCISQTRGRHVFASFLVSSRHYHALKQMTKQHDMPYGSSLTFLGHVMLIYYILEGFLFTIWIYPIVNYSL